MKHGGVWTSCPTGKLKVTVGDPSCVNKYAFGTKAADFRVCSACSVVPVVTSEIGSRVYAVVSVNAFDGIDSSLLHSALANFDGEGQDDRLARRKCNRIADVRFAAGRSFIPGRDEPSVPAERH